MTSTNSLSVNNVDSQVTCKFCSSKLIVRNGTRMGTQYWLCTNCGRGFVYNRALPRMRYPIEMVVDAILMFYHGSSLVKIRRQVERKLGYGPSDAVIYRWIGRFSKVAYKEATKYSPNTCDSWVLEESNIKIRNKNYWLWDIFDLKSKFLIYTCLSPVKNDRVYKRILTIAIKKAGKSPKRIIAREQNAYPCGIESDVNAYATNAKCSSFHNSLEERRKVMRRFHTAEAVARITTCWQSHYNFFKRQKILGGKTPSQVACIEFPFRTWLDLAKSETAMAKESNAPWLPRVVAKKNSESG